jgi:hypothetical protein
MRAELYIEAESAVQENPQSLPAGLVGVLSPGNFDAPTDVLHVMFLQNQVCVCSESVFISLLYTLDNMHSVVCFPHLLPSRSQSLSPTR